jgi:hypothetical protein
MGGQARGCGTHARRRAAWGGPVIGLVLATLTVASCVIGDIDLDGRHCPCVAPYVCDQASQACALAPSDAGPADAHDAEAGPDGGAPASLYCELREGEAGTLQAPMQVGADPTASNGHYVFTDTSEEGSVSWVFDVAQAGQYVLQARVLALPPEGAMNSFYVGLDGEPAQGDETRVFHAIPLAVVWTWDSVSWSGNAVGPEASEFDPKVWELTAGEHVFTFYGREAGTELDEVALRQCPLEGGCAALLDEGCPAQSDGG